MHCFTLQHGIFSYQILLNLGRRPYHVRRRYFGGKKRSEEGTSKRIASALRLRSSNNNNKRGDNNMREDHVRGLRHENTRYNTNDMGYTVVGVQDGLSKLSNAELNDVLVNAANEESLNAAIAARSENNNAMYEEALSKKYLDLTAARKNGRMISDEETDDGELGVLLEDQ